MPPDEHTVNNIVLVALEIQDRAKRDAYVEQACQGVPDLLAEVKSLLESDQPARFLGIHSTIRHKVFSHYVVEEPIGYGGMGLVYRGRDTKMSRPVAIKVLQVFSRNDQEARTRLVKEALTVAAFNHPNIVTIYDTVSEEDVEYLVMEYIEGRTLDTLIPKNGLPLERTLPLVVQLASALSATHKAGIFHRDLKPSNIMVRHDGYVKLLDFGIARRVGQDADTEDFGTAAYRAPEMVATPQSEVYAFGLVLFEILCGYHPFIVISKANGSQAHDFDSMRPIRSKVPVSLGRIIARCLKRNPGERFASMSEVLAALETISDSRNRWSARARLKPPPRATNEALHRTHALLPRISYLSWSESVRAFDDLKRILREKDCSPTVMQAVASAMLRLIITNFENGDLGMAGSVREVRRLAMDLIVMATKGKVAGLFYDRDFEHLDLFKMNFTQCQLGNLSFSGSQLMESNFKESNLSRASFSAAFIRNVNFEDADLAGVDFTGADWFNAIGLTQHQLESAKRETLSDCPPDTTALHEYLARHYAVSFQNWHSTVRKDLVAAWDVYLQPGGLRDTVAAWNRGSRQPE